MASLREYFDTDFNRVLNAFQSFSFSDGNTELLVPVRVHLDFDSHVKFLSCYISSCPNPAAVCAALLNSLKDLLAIDNDIVVQSKLPGETIMDSRSMGFSGKIFFYSENNILENEFDNLRNQAQENGLYIQYRGPQFAKERAKLEKPLAFISHDSRDKDIVARPIAIALSRFMCPVWFDDFSLMVGDPLRETIEKGLKECKKCILILSPNFINNPGWTKVEFNSIFTREILEKENLVLPVWYGVDKNDIYEYCPSLLNRVAVNWNLGSDEVVRRLHQAILKDNRS